MIHAAVGQRLTDGAVVEIDAYRRASQCTFYGSEIRILQGGTRGIRNCYFYDCQIFCDETDDINKALQGYNVIHGGQFNNIQVRGRIDTGRYIAGPGELLGWRWQHDLGREAIDPVAARHLVDVAPDRYGKKAGRWIAVWEVEA
jgi:hypothetical protein